MQVFDIWDTFDIVTTCRRNVSKAMDECIEGEQDVEKMVPELDEKDQKSYETVQKIIKGVNNICIIFVFTCYIW